MDLLPLLRDVVDLEELRPLTGGASSLTFVGVRPDGERAVVKVAPPGLPPVRNRDVLRQARLLRHLAPTGLVPRVLSAGQGEGDLPPWFVMSWVDGECVEPVLADRRSSEDHATNYARGLSAAEVLAALHAVDPPTERPVSLAAEVDRWTQAFATVPDDLRGDHPSCAAKLLAHLPEAVAPRVNHGDFRLGNTLCQGGRVAAVIDWEIWSVGDPRVDLAWLAYFTDEVPHPAAPSNDPTGIPSIGELVAAYEEQAGPVTDLAWFHALTRYKEAAATALLIKRARRSGQLPPALARMEPLLPSLLDDAVSYL
ncbi:MAG: phosphotransferase family protein [Frankiales bacterium]|nr:phosphotransferase family protein [Frankiales bacterium]